MSRLDSNPAKAATPESAQALRELAEHYWRLADLTPDLHQSKTYKAKAMAAHASALKLEHGWGDMPQGIAS